MERIEVIWSKVTPAGEFYTVTVKGKNGKLYTLDRRMSQWTAKKSACRIDQIGAVEIDGQWKEG